MSKLAEDSISRFEEVKHFKDLTLKERMDRDNYKEKMAMDHGYSVTRVLQTDVYWEKIEWRKKLLGAIEDVHDNETCAVKL